MNSIIEDGKKKEKDKRRKETKIIIGEYIRLE